jgi:signal transduction histidine kinase
MLEVQGGRIWAKARDGGGSEFGFALPLSEPTELAGHRPD